MLAIERKNQILNKLKTEQRVLVSELATTYQVTEETIRRDLDKLEKEGFEEIKISGNRSEELPVMHAVDKDNISTATIFKAAKIFIAELTN